MGNLNKWVAAFCVSVVVVCMQVIVSQWMWIGHLRMQLDLSSDARRLANDQIQDLMVQLDTARSENLAVGTRQFTAGIMAAIQKPDQYTEVWHDGYDRGVAVQTYAYETEKRDAAYTKDNNADER